MNARSVRNKFLRFPMTSVLYRSSASCSTMEKSRSSEKRESGGSKSFVVAILSGGHQADCEIDDVHIHSAIRIHIE